MNMRGIYRGAARWLREQVRPDASDGVVLLVGGMAAVGLLLIAALWGIPT